MIVGTAAGLPVVAAVATHSRHSCLVECPFCQEVHTHGGWGPASPAGAFNDARMSHCDEIRVGKESGYYVLFEVPGRTGRKRSEDRLRVCGTVEYELDRMPDLQARLTEWISAYESVWEALGQPRRSLRGKPQVGYDYPPFDRGEVRWPFAYGARGPLRHGEQPFAGVSRRADKEQRRLRNYLRQAAEEDWLAREILNDLEFPVETIDYDTWASYLDAYSDSDNWEDDLGRLWDGFSHGFISTDKIRVNHLVDLIVDTHRTYCVLLMDRERLHDCLYATGPVGSGEFAGATAKLREDLVFALESFRPVARKMFRKIEYKGSWQHLSSGRWYNLHVPVAFRQQAIDAMTAAEVHRDAGLLRALLADLVGPEPVAGERTAIYLWSDADGAPIYYGITKDMHSRQTRHARYGAWGVFSASCRVEWVDSRDEALKVERELIERDRPIFNRQHNDTPQAREALVRYLTSRGRADLLIRA